MKFNPPEVTKASKPPEVTKASKPPIESIRATTVKICAEIRERKRLERLGLHDPLAGFSPGFKQAAKKAANQRTFSSADEEEFYQQNHEEF